MEVEALKMPPAFVEPLAEIRDPTLEATWWLFKEAKIPNLVKAAGDFLDAMYERYKVTRAMVDEEPCVFEARYEMKKYDEDLTHEKAILPQFASQKDNMVGWMDYLSGFPYGITEMQIRLWEMSSANSLYPTESDPGAPVPPFPADLFDETYEAKDRKFDYLYIEDDTVDAFADGLPGEDETELLWWMRTNHLLPNEADEPQKYPYPGEFVSMGIRMFVDKPWGDNETSPFLFSGNWVDTLYYTSAVVVEVIEPTDMRPFRLYKVRWRGNPENSGDPDYNKFLARPSGFEEYKVDDRVAILKDAATERTSQTWKDDKLFDETIWRICPATFYERPEDYEMPVEGE